MIKLVKNPYKHYNIQLFINSGLSLTSLLQRAGTTYTDHSDSSNSMSTLVSSQYSTVMI